jgi:hypothetical protein
MSKNKKKAVDIRGYCEIKTNKTEMETRYVDDDVSIDKVKENSDNIIDIDNINITQRPHNYIERRVANCKKGDEIEEKTSGDIRLLYQNINSLRPTTLDKWKATIDRIEFLKADVVGLSKTCVNWNNNKTRQIYSNVINKKFKKSTIVFAKIPKFNEHQRKYLPGGTLSMTVKDMVDKNKTSIEVKYYKGRWTGNYYHLGKGKRLNIITAHRVTSAQTGTSKTALTSNAQQVEIQRDRNLQHIQPRKQFITDFIYQFKEMFADENNFNILMIDANENIETPENEGICKLISSLNLVNIYQQIHLDYSTFPTKNNGSKTIDYMLGSSNVLGYITKVGYLRFH